MFCYILSQDETSVPSRHMVPAFFPIRFFYSPTCTISCAHVLHHVTPRDHATHALQSLGTCDHLRKGMGVLEL